MSRRLMWGVTGAVVCLGLVVSWFFNTFERVSVSIGGRFEERFGVKPRLSQLRSGVGPLELR